MEQRVRRYRSDRDLRQCGFFEGSKFRSQWYQGTANGMEWLRLSLEGKGTGKVCVYATDVPTKEWDASMVPVLEREALDLSLYGVHGCFLAFTVEPAEGLKGFTLSFPGRSIDAGLPFVMRDDATLRQFLAVYQSAYMDTNQQAARFPGRLDPYDPEMLPDLGLWVGAARWLRDSVHLPDLLAAAPMLNRMRGTRRGLDQLIKLVTGSRGQIIEDFQWRDQPLNLSERANCTRLYGEEQASVVVLLPTDTTSSAMRFLENILDDFIPLGETYSIFQLQEGAELDGHFYLDVNTTLQEPPPAALDESDLDDLTLE